VGIIESLAVALGASFMSGLNLYGVVLMLGGLGFFGLTELPDGLQILSSPYVLAAVGLLYAAEFIADKIPGVDSLWDILHTFVRIPGGSFLAFAALDGIQSGLTDDVHFAVSLAAGGLLAAIGHGAKSGSRMILNTSPEPITNLLASLAEDVLVAFVLMFMLFKPLAFFFIFACLLVLTIWLLTKIARGLKLFVLRFMPSGNSNQEDSDEPNWALDRHSR
tara:strand:- start:525 stop:1184 length:660 start_codon:yes stop_codon:yes gene_type:complete